MARAPSAAATGPSDVSARLDRLPATRYLWGLVGLVSFGAFFEIYDLALSGPLSLGLLAAGIFKPGNAGLLHLNDQATFNAATFAGLYVGTLGFSAAADRFGRRPIFTVALLWYAVATAIMGLQNRAAWIDIWRFVASVGVGVELVAIDCYLAELMPAPIRGRAFAISASIQFLSAPLVAFLAWFLIPGDLLRVAGWRWLALLPAIGAALVWWVRRNLPESPRWLAAHGRSEQAGAVLLSMEARVAQDLRVSPDSLPLPATDPDVASSVETGGGTPSLWSRANRRATLVLVIFHVFQTIGYYGFSNWLPTLLVAKGVTVSKSLGYSAILALVAPVAPLLFSTFADRFPRKWLLVAGALVAAGAGLLMATVTPATPFLKVTLVGGATAVGLSLMSLSYHTYQSEVFPTAVRARGVGFVYSFSRLSGFFTSFLIAAVLGRAGSAGVFMLIAGSMVVVATDVAIFGPGPAEASVPASP